MKQITTHIEPLRDGAFLHCFRRGKLETRLRLGPNHVHAFIERKDGSREDLGISKNLLTNSGRDLWANAFGHATQFSGVTTSIATATTMTATGGAFPTSGDGLKGWRVYQPITGITTAPVYANIGSNTATVLTVDAWWTAADATAPAGTPPASGNAYVILPCCVPRFMALTTDSATAAATDSVLATENNANGCSRTKATFAHTAATATYTMQVVYSITGTITALHKMGLFTNSLAAGGANGGIMVFETNLNLDATVGNGDTLTVTDTITLSG